MVKDIVEKKMQISKIRIVIRNWLNPEKHSLNWSWVIGNFEQKKDYSRWLKQQENSFFWLITISKIKNKAPTTVPPWIGKVKQQNTLKEVKLDKANTSLQCHLPVSSTIKLKIMEHDTKNSIVIVML